MELDERIAELAARQHGVITYRQLVSLGASSSAIKHRARSTLVRVHPQVYRIRGAPVTTRARLLAAVLAAGDGACASHRTSSALFGIPGFQLSSYDITVPYGRRPRLDFPNIHFSAMPPDWHRRVVDAIPTTSIARTLFDLCGLLHPRRAERALDNALAREIVTIPACWRVFSDLAERGRKGSALMRELLLARGEGYVAPASELEARLLALLSDAGLPAPAREIDIGDVDGWVGRVELVYREAHVLIEADSRRHHTALLDRQADLARDNRFTADKWRVLRFTWEQITERPDYVVTTVRRALSGNS
jgi:hypothetical protein